jgi:choline dehydrogenase-like flavoprotein
MTVAALVPALLVLGGVSLRSRPSAREGPLRLRGGAAETWDYIVVGGGTAGCVLSERLSADPDNRVLVLEAGTDGSRDMRIRIPAGLVKVFKSERDWDFETEPVQGTNRGIYLCRGRVLGGSSATNVMLYHRGTPADYDSWVQKGAVGWGPSEVLDYFRRAENNVDGASQYHGTVRESSRSKRAKSSSARKEPRARRGCVPARSRCTACAAAVLPSLRF